MKQFITILLLCTGVAFNPTFLHAQDTSAKGHETKKVAALKSARIWLELLESGRFSDSYDATSALFQKNVTKEDWKKSMEGVRSPLGKMLSREVIAQRYLSEMPGAPDGEYVVIQFRTSFENKEEAIETITPIMENGAWKVSGYFIK